VPGRLVDQGLSTESQRMVETGPRSTPWRARVVTATTPGAASAGEPEDQMYSVRRHEHQGGEGIPPGKVKGSRAHPNGAAPVKGVAVTSVAEGVGDEVLSVASNRVPVSLQVHAGLGMR
jgi:hypothetical protein